MIVRVRNCALWLTVFGQTGSKQRIQPLPFSVSGHATSASGPVQKRGWTGFGKVTYYVLFFIHVGTRRVRIAGMTCQPSEPWVEQQARNFVMELADRGETATHVIKDGDTKFTEKFNEIFKSEGIKVKRLPFASPNLNP